MRRLSFLLVPALALALTGPALAAPADDPAFAAIVKALPTGVAMPALVARAAERLIGRPYASGLLDAVGTAEQEPLVSRLDAFDCVTLVETSLAVARAQAAGDPTRARFERELEALRYRGGRREGYASRLHYFSEWIADNAARGHLIDMTAALGGAPDRRPLNFMTTHRASYRKLGDAGAYAALREAEQRLARSPRPVLPKAKLAGVLPLLQTGDVVAFTTGIAGLDVVHTGLVYRRADGAVHLLHAPEPGASVVVSSRTLVEQLAAYGAYTGVMIARPLAPRAAKGG